MAVFEGVGILMGATKRREGGELTGRWQERRDDGKLDAPSRFLQNQRCTIGPDHPRFPCRGCCLGTETD